MLVFRNRAAHFFLLLLSLTTFSASPAPGQKSEVLWKKHVVFSNTFTFTAAAADFTGDGLLDVVSNGNGQTRLFIAPDWTPVPIGGGSYIHSAILDVDDDGDPDYIGAEYSPGRIRWLECPPKPESDPWRVHLVDSRLNGTHGILKGDVDRDGKLDLLAGSAQSSGPFPVSLLWYRVPENPTDPWERHILGNKDAPGLGHYFGFGDVNGDGRPDAAHGAKGGSEDAAGLGNWFAWWEAPEDPTEVWTKHLISDEQPGATNIHPADLNGDGKVDFLASRGHGQGIIWFEAPDWKEHTIHATIPGAHCLVAADLDNDGDIDGATCSFEAEVAAWFENDGKGNFTIHTLKGTQSAYDIRALDMEGDGDLDLLIGGHSSGNAVWFENLLDPVEKKFIRGDTNGDLSLNFLDGVATISFLFRGQPLSCPDAADFDDNGVVNITDVIGVLDYMINSGTAPAAPFPGPGVDPTEDSRECR